MEALVRPTQQQLEQTWAQQRLQMCRSLQEAALGLSQLVQN
jgi:hypothetical protein